MTKRTKPIREAIFPGSFDPITNGHLDIVERSLRVFDRLVVAVAYNPGKDRSMFSPEERVEILKDTIRDDRVEADAFSGLLVDYAKRREIPVIVRGLRAVADFEYEFQMATMNRYLSPDIETLYIMAGQAHYYTSSRLVKEVATYGGDIEGLVPAPAFRAMQEKLGMPLGKKKKGAR